MRNLNVVALAGGVGGAKLAAGLQAILNPGNLTVVVNTGDDFEHWGLNICTDLDTVMYNLAGVNHPEHGWGRADDTFVALQTMSQLGGEDWFMLGDRDLSVHLRRTEWLRQGNSLTEVTERLRRSFGIPSSLYPMSDTPVRTLVHTDEGDLPFQHYFVRRRAEPILIDLTFVGADTARMSGEVQNALESADVVVFCPSNPYLSIDPILSIPGLRECIRWLRAPKIAVSPIVSGKAIKGPAAKIMKELGVMISPLTVVDHYADLLTGFVVGHEDEVLCDAVHIPTLVTDIIMTDLVSKARLAEQVLDFARQLKESSEHQAASRESKAKRERS
ncbi:MAG: 2-phospho-L-lactate transferase [Caldilineaceae bacterium]